MEKPRWPVWRLALLALLSGVLLSFLPMSYAAAASQDQGKNDQNQGKKHNQNQGKHDQYQHDHNGYQHDHNGSYNQYHHGDHWQVNDSHKYKYKNKHGKYQKTRVVYVFVPAHRERMRDYYVMHRSDLPPYYYDDYYDSLPPGLQRQLVVRGYFPRELEYRLHPFPSELNRWLGPPPYGTRRVMFGRDAYLLQDRTNLILDIISDLARR